VSDFPIITAITLLPLIGGLIVVGLGEEQKCLARKLALGFSLASLALAIGLWHN
jgi:NADH-quinone oxidoreductase subunit M